MHQFIQAGLVIQNPDQPDRATNSPKWCYQIEPSTLALIHGFGTKKWSKNLEDYLSKIITLKQKYEKHRNMLMIPVTLPKNKKIELSRENTMN